jgi:hypothetical protein
VRTAILASLCFLWPLTSQAADEIKPLDVKPGLWETTTEIAGMPAMAMPTIPPEALAKMTPQQRAQIEGMMKSRGGSLGGPMTARSCVTRESLSKAMALGQRDSSCTYKVISSTPARQQVSVECTRENVKSSGDVTVERADTEHFKGTVAMKGTAGERAIDTKMTFASKWISADCGDVKPFDAK